MSALDLARMERIRIHPRPLLQQFFASTVFWANFRFLPGVEIVWENLPELPKTPVILAVNHTDRYNYFPLLWKWWWDLGRFSVAWMKGKYYENAILGGLMERLGTLPTVSRGYMIVRDFRAVTGKLPDDESYRLLRAWLEKDQVPPPGVLPEPILTRPRDILGRPFDPARETYAEAMNAVYVRLMEKFIALHAESFRAGRDLLIYPEGTRSVRLSRGRPGIGQIALHFNLPVLPVGCSGSDRIYPGASPLARRGRVVYRFGEFITPETLAPFRVPEDFRPFTPEAERRWRANFQGVADLVMERINELVDPPYRAAGPGGEAEKGARRFV